MIRSIKYIFVTIISVLALLQIDHIMADSMSLAISSAALGNSIIESHEASKAQSMAAMSIDMNHQCNFCLENEATACKSDAICDLCKACPNFENKAPIYTGPTILAIILGLFLLFLIILGNS